jgi:hypothetical protein
MTLPKPVLEVSEDELADHIEAGDGVCLHCHEWTCGGVEPDASGYKCTSCERMAVFGAEIALIMGRVELA